jgi:hypothetical protein
MSATSKFGGSSPKDSATKVKQKGNTGSSSGGGINISRKTNVKQVGTNTSGGGNSTLHHKPVGRPNLPGKEDNRGKC